MHDDQFYESPEYVENPPAESHGDEVFVTAPQAGYNLELRAIYQMHQMLGEQMGQYEDEAYNFPRTQWQVTSVEIQPFKVLDDRYAHALWGVCDFVDQPGGAFIFMEHAGAQVVTGLSESDLETDEGMAYVEVYMQVIAMIFQHVWAEHEVANFDVQVFPSPTAPSLLDLQPMFPGLNNKTPLITTAFRVTSPGLEGAARVVLGIPQAYLHPVEASLQAVGEMTYATTDTTHYMERLNYLEDVPIPVTVKLGKAEMTVGDLQSLEEGDVILLDTTVGLPLEVRLGKTVRHGKPGTTADGRRLAVQLVEGAS